MDDDEEFRPQDEVDEYELDIDGIDEDEAFEIAAPRSRRGKSSVATKRRKRRRGEIFHCKHGCGYTYVRKSGEKSDRSARDAYDYHETQGCQLLPRLLCPLGCKRKGKLVSFGGIKALRNHYKSKGHLQQMAEQGVTKMEKLSAVDGPPASVPQLPPVGIDDDSSDSSESSESSSSLSSSESSQSTRKKAKTEKEEPQEVGSIFNAMLGFSDLLEEGEPPAVAVKIEQSDAPVNSTASTVPTATGAEPPDAAGVVGAADSAQTLPSDTAAQLEGMQQ